MEWRLAEAKNKFSELFNRTLAEGPQTIFRRDEAVVVMSQRDYQRLTGEQPSLKDYLLDANISLDDVPLERDQSPARGVDL